MSNADERQSDNGETREEAPRMGAIKDMGVLDLSAARSEDALSTIGAMKDVGVVLIPEPLLSALMRIPMKDVAAVVPIPAGENVVVMTGETRLTGDILAAGDPQSLLVVAGRVFITTRVVNVGYAGLYLTGQIYAPRGSEAALAAKIRRLSGQLQYYPEGARFFSGHDELDREFFELLPQPTPLFVSGHCEIAGDVTPDLFKAKVPEIVVTGHLEVPKSLLALVRILAVDSSGHISGSR